MDFFFRTLNIRRLQESRFTETEASEFAKQNLDLVAVQEVRWDKGGSEPVNDYIFFCGNGNVHHHLGRGCFVHK
jgi:hypothetical protein